MAKIKPTTFYNESIKEKDKLFFPTWSNEPLGID
jgi:hypothetical protein